MLPGQVDLQPLLHPLLDRAGWAPGSPFEVLEEESGFRQFVLGLVACLARNVLKRFKIDWGLQEV